MNASEDRQHNRPNPAVNEEKDSRSKWMFAKGTMSTLELKDGYIRIKNWPNESVIDVNDIIDVSIVAPGMLLDGYLHITTAENSTPPANRIMAANHPQCLVFGASQATVVQELYSVIREFVAANLARNPSPKITAKHSPANVAEQSKPTSPLTEEHADSRPCKHCQRPVNRTAKTCPHCGGKDPYPVNPIEVVIGLGILLALGYVCFAFIPGCLSSEPGKIEAWGMAKQFVTERLKSPSSASFGGIIEDYQDPDKVVSDLGNGKFRVRAWVDAQNSFGATIRTQFACDLEYTGNDNWRCTNLEMNDP